MPIYVDTAAFTRSHVARLLASQGMSYPTTLVIDRKGIIRDAWMGMADLGKLEANIKKIVLQSSPDS